MKLSPINENEFQIWREMREIVYDSLGNEFHDREMIQIFQRDDWYCLFIKNENQGQGIGTESVEAIKMWCKERGFSELGADTELENVKAQEFFKSVGFQETYRIVEFCTKIK